ncbi:MAG: tetratricopeptide repeat protein [Phycisphaerales bacterium]|nr:MAG: tetratricopeptide repeat protein [Phycisphaerales bacterium]
MKTGGNRLAMWATVVIVAAVARVVKAEMVAYWKLDDSNGATAVDCVGGHNGTVRGNPVWVDGCFGGALRFDGIDDRVNCGGGKDEGDPDTWADIVGPITVGAWIKVGAFKETNQIILGKGNDTWRLNSMGKMGRVQFTGNIQPARWRVQTKRKTKLNDNRWHHLVGVYEGSTASLYVDGALELSLTNARQIRKSGRDVFIGGLATAPASRWRGCIDDVVLFNHALSENEVRNLYELSGDYFRSEVLRSLGTALEEAQTAFEASRPNDSAAFIEKKISECKKTAGEDIEALGYPQKMVFSKLYFMLAKAKESSKAPADEVSAAYSGSACLSVKSPNYALSALWLRRNRGTGEFAKIVRQSIRNTENASLAVGASVRDFEVEGDWAAFEEFLDIVFSEVDDVTLCARTVCESLRRRGSWAGKFATYSRNKPELSQYLVAEQDKLAKQAARNGDFLKAAEICRGLLPRCDADQKAQYELQVCEYVFRSGQCEKAIAEIQGFIDKYRLTNRDKVIQATLLKGRTYLQMNDTNRAADIFLDLMVDYPEAKKAPQANFFIGYCSMLQGNFEEAREALEFVVKDYPKSTYASKAKLCLRRMDKMAD